MIFPHAQRYKSISEKIDFTFDFVDEIPAGDTIKPIGVNSATNVIARTLDGTDVSSTLVANKGLSVSGTGLTARLVGGSAQDYKIFFTAEMSMGGQVIERVLLLRVRDTVNL